MIDKTQLQWENYKMRQSHVWKSFDRLILSVVTLWAIPFIKLELFSSRYVIFLFPIVALLLSFAGTFLFMAEYNRLIAVFEKVKEDDENLDFMNLKSGKKNTKLKTKQVGPIMLCICIGLIVLSFLDLFFIIAKLSGLIKDL
jgi:hypothetical protein